MEGGTVQFLVFLLIIILIKESWAAAAATLDVSPRYLAKSGDSATVSWAGIATPTQFDFLGIYSPPDLEHDNFIGWVELSSVSSSSSPRWESGSGTIDIPLVNMRTPYQFRLFGGRKINATAEPGIPVDEDGDPIPTTESLLAVSSTIHFSNYNEPTQIHLALTSEAGEMRVMFVTRDAINSIVRYGEDGAVARLTRVSKASMETYERQHMCDAPANTVKGWRDPGIIYDAVMSKLKPGKRYFYQVGSDEGRWSDVHSFLFPDLLADETDALLYGDMGVQPPYKTFLWPQKESELTLQWLQRDIAELAAKGKAPFLSHIGDISYARGYAFLWDEFFHRIQPVASRAAYHVCIGNHEYDWPLQPWKPDYAEFGTDGGGECGVPYSRKFHMPGDSSLDTGNASPATRNLYYSLSVGVVHFIYFSTETNFLEGSDQHTFIEEDLKAVDRRKTPFVVFLGHRPMYSSELDHGIGSLFKIKMIESLEPLLVKYKVNLALWGHVHKYERTCPIQNFACSVTNASSGATTTTNPSTSSAQAAPVHVVIGMAGQDWQPSWQPRAAHPDDPIFPQPSWSLYRGTEFGYVRLHATKSLLTLTYVGNHDGRVHDVLRIGASAAAAEEEIVGSPFCIEDTWLWSLLCFVFALLLGAAAGVFITVWRIRGFQTLKQSVNIKPSGPYQQLRNNEDFGL